MKIKFGEAWFDDSITAEELNRRLELLNCQVTNSTKLNNKKKELIVALYEEKTAQQLIDEC